MHSPVHTQQRAASCTCSMAVQTDTRLCCTCNKIGSQASVLDMLLMQLESCILGALRVREFHRLATERVPAMILPGS